MRKGQTRLTQRDGQIPALYGKGLGTRDIVDAFREMYDADVSAALISKVTDRVLDTVVEWQNRPGRTVWTPGELHGHLYLTRSREGKPKSKSGWRISDWLTEHSPCDRRWHNPSGSYRTLTRDFYLFVASRENFFCAWNGYPSNRTGFTDAPPPGTAWAGLRPEACHWPAERPVLPVLAGRVVSVEPVGHEQIVHLQPPACRRTNPSLQARPCAWPWITGRSIGSTGKARRFSADRPTGKPPANYLGRKSPVVIK